MSKHDEHIRKLLALPPIAWQDAVTEILKDQEPQEVCELAHAMEDDVGRLAYLAEYIPYRSGGYGCGKYEHKDAAKEARKQCKKVNKALGYTFPDRRVPGV